MPSIETMSLAPGTLAPLVPPEVLDQVDVEFQLPLATENRFAAFTLTAPITRSSNPIIKLFESLKEEMALAGKDMLFVVNNVELLDMRMPIARFLTTDLLMNVGDGLLVKYFTI